MGTLQVSAFLNLEFFKLSVSYCYCPNIPLKSKQFYSPELLLLPTFNSVDIFDVEKCSFCFDGKKSCERTTPKHVHITVWSIV